MNESNLDANGSGSLVLRIESERDREKASLLLLLNESNREKVLEEKSSCAAGVLGTESNMKGLLPGNKLSERGVSDANGFPPKSDDKQECLEQSRRRMICPLKPSFAFAEGLGTESENIDSFGGRKSFDRVEPVFIGLMLKSSNPNPNPKPLSCFS
ncbi:hypothetical protein HID58_025886 [Brassica napus]|uniref:Auxin-responsive protein n=1 Tax=Brassica napus TaxID=3708 RepID=A0ABQ8CMF9_BRANA|nr:hypothetical protein HID58_025886 [Brassica napus]